MKFLSLAGSPASHRLRVVIQLSLLGVCAATLAGAQTLDQSQIAGLQWRSIGPFRGGRVSSVTGVLGQPGTFYIGMAQGGIWKTTSAGVTWFPVADSIKEVSCFGSVQAAPSNGNVVYAGSGEAIGGAGNGVYKSTDAGSSWTHVGLEGSHQVPSLLVDPHNPDVVLAAALGDTGDGANEQRGVYRTSDGGKTWTNTLSVGKLMGVTNIAWAYDNPSVVFAVTMPHFRTKPGEKPPKTEPSAIYKSTDEGLTWTKSPMKGINLIVGRSCLAVAQNTNSQRVFLIGTFGLYRSDDGGENWSRTAGDDPRIANGQGNYTSGVYVDSKNPDIVYTLATCVYRSLDGGKTFEGFKGAPGGDDPQQMWIDPTDGNRILLGGDQGAAISQDAGGAWSLWYNQPTAQVYHITTDTQYPYWVYATQQDSGCIGTSSRGNYGAITWRDWTTNPGFEFGTIAIDPLNPKISYSQGPNLNVMRVTEPSGQYIEVGPTVNPESGLRSGFNQPLAFSPNNPHELIAGYQCLMATTDGGVHWNAISPDLTVGKDGKAAGGGGRFGPAIDSFSVSSKASNVIWAGTNNGLVQVTRDHGKTWEDASIPNLPEAKRADISCIDASHTDAAAAYAAVTVPGDDHAHFFRTRDYGKTWKEIDRGLPTDAPAGNIARVIRADTRRDGLLFAGTESGMFVSFNDGDEWQSLMLNLPTTSFRDIQIHDNDLVIGTYGRGLWILDDYSPLREISPTTAAESAHLFKPGEAIRVRRNVNGDTPFPPEVPHAMNPPLGAVIYYSLAAKPAGDITLDILDAGGKLVRHMSSAPIQPYDDPPPAVPQFWVEIRKPLPAEIGLNRINWNIRQDTPPAFNHDVQDVMGAMVHDTPQAIEGPLALPGTYTAKLTVDGKSYTQTFVVKNDPRSPAKDSDLRAQHEVQMDIYDGVVESWNAYRQIADMRAQVKSVLDAKPSDDVAKAAKNLDDDLAAMAGKVRHERKFFGPPPPTSFVNLNGYLLTELDALDFGDMAPTDSRWMAYGTAWSKLHALMEKWRAFNAKDLATFNALLAKNNLKPIAPAEPLAEPAAPASRYLPKVSKAATTPPKSNRRDEFEQEAEGGGEG